LKEKRKMNSFLAKFKYAGNGLKELTNESSFKIQLVCAAAVIIAAFIFAISSIEWIVLILLISLVLTSEAFNTALEKTCDLFCNSWLLTEVKIIKDISSAAVALFSAAAVIIGLIIFIPKL
jgi:diacylglycerol kinase